MTSETILLSRHEPPPTHRFTLDSYYVERFWLPVLGPTSIALLRWGDRLLRGNVESIDTWELAAGLGLGLDDNHHLGVNHPLRRSLVRLDRFSAGKWSPATATGPARLSLPRCLPWISSAARRRLPPMLFVAHEAEVAITLAEVQP